MSRSLKKRKNHWTNKVHESVLCRNEEGELGLELKGGAENGQFPVVGELVAGGALCHSGKLCPDELLLEVNDTPVAGLTTRDVHAVVKHSKDPVRLKCVRQGERFQLSHQLSPHCLHSCGSAKPLVCDTLFLCFDSSAIVCMRWGSSFCTVL